MSMPPKVKRVLTPPSVPTSLLSATTSNPQHLTGMAVNNLACASDLTRYRKSVVGTGGTAAASSSNHSLQRKLCVHPAMPLVAYSLDEMVVTMSQQTGLVGAVAAGTSSVVQGVVGVGGGGGPQTTTRVSQLHRIITVQNTVTQQVVYSLSIQQLAAAVFPKETANGSDAKKVIAAVKAIGNIHSLQFYDSSTLYWSGMAHSCSTANGTGNGAGDDASKNKKDGAKVPDVGLNLGGSHRWQALAVQTDKRIFLLNLRQGPNGRGVAASPTLPPSTPNGGAGGASQNAYDIVLANLQETVLAAQPSSNILPLSDRWLLVGCIDGSLKCYDWKSKTVIKSIKGLGKGDWIVQLSAANRYNQWSDEEATTTEGSGPGSSSTVSGGAGGKDGTGSSSNGTATLLVQRRRILTLTKKGICYLIEVDISPTTLEIKPPLARFVGGQPECADKNSPDAMEHVLLKYDPHGDLILWYHPTNKPHPILFVWSLRLLTEDLIQQQTSSKTLFKPDPNLTVEYPFIAPEVVGGGGSSGGGSSGGGNTILTGLVHGSFSEETVLSMSVTATGDVFLLGAVAHPNNTVSKSPALPVLACNLGATLQRDAHLDDLNASDINIRVHSVHAQSLPTCPGGCEVVVGTNWGLILLDIPPVVTANDVRPAASVGSPHLHFSANLGSLGKSVLSMQHSAIVFGTLDVLKNNPVGAMQPKNQVVVHESAAPAHIPDELKRPFRLAPTFLASPSGLYVALFWPDEYRYEILHAPTLMQRVGKQRSAGAAAAHAAATGHHDRTRGSAVASGFGVTGFAWVGDDDVYCVLHNGAVMEQAFAASVMAVHAAKEAEGSGGIGLDIDLKQLTNLRDIRGVSTGVANLGLSAVKASLYGTMSIAKVTTSASLTVGKVATSATVAATMTTLSASKNVALTTTKGVVSATKATTNQVTKGTKSVTSGMKKGGKKVLKVFGLKKSKKGSGEESNIMADGDEAEEMTAETASSLSMQAEAAMAALQAGGTAGELKPGDQRPDRPHVELRALVAVESQASEIGGGSAAATSSSLGELSLRGGNRNPPTVVFGGPVLCVGSRSPENEKGHAHFYTRKKDEKDNHAGVYVSSGPTLPYPDIVAWDDDGRLCAVVVQYRVAVYLSSVPDFTLLGTVRLASPTGGADPDGGITSVRFLHGVLYCCTGNAVHCVFLGDTTGGGGGGICFMDAYLLASTHVPILPQGSLETIGNSYSSFSPPTVPLPLVQPVVLGYQNGSLVVSTARGVHAIPLAHPILRIGVLLASGQVDRAVRWFDAVPDADHEPLARFLERRGHPELSLRLPGVSLETIVDVSMRYGYAGRLEEVVETYGAKGLRAIDMGRGVSSGASGTAFGPAETHRPSVVVCVGAYLLAHGRVELTRQLATECLRSGEEGRKDALLLGALLLSVDEADASRLMHRAVEEGGNGGGAGAGAVSHGTTTTNVSAMSEHWLMGNFVRDHVLSGTGGNRA